MHKNLIKNFLVLAVPLSNLICDFAFSHKNFDTRNVENIGNQIVENNSKINSFNEIDVSMQNNVEDNLMKSFDNYPNFRESMGPVNQFQNLFRNSDRELKKSVFRLWETYEKEMSNQIGSQRLNGTDINNTFNDSLNSLSK